MWDFLCSSWQEQLQIGPGKKEACLCRSSGTADGGDTVEFSQAVFNMQHAVC